MKICKAICKSCPFARASIPGWLGEYRDPQHFLAVHFKLEELNPCHMTVDYDNPNWDTDLESDSSPVRACRGQQIFMRNTCKRPRGWSLDESVEPDHVAVFSSTAEFTQHHTQDRTAWLKANKEILCGSSKN